MTEQYAPDKVKKNIVIKVNLTKSQWDSLMKACKIAEKQTPKKPAGFRRKK